MSSNAIVYRISLLLASSFIKQIFFCCNNLLNINIQLIVFMLFSNVFFCFTYQVFFCYHDIILIFNKKILFYFSTGINNLWKTFITPITKEK